VLSIRAGGGLRLFGSVDFALLGSVEIWQMAATQILYSTSCALGVLPTYASFNPRRQV
jgi:SNF family Na+-dependent transporter